MYIEIYDTFLKNDNYDEAGFKKLLLQEFRNVKREKEQEKELIINSVNKTINKYNSNKQKLWIMFNS